MAKLHDLRQQHKAALDAAESVLKTAEAAGRKLTIAEKASLDSHMVEAEDLSKRIDHVETHHTLLAQAGPKGMLLPGNGAIDAGFSTDFAEQRRLAQARNPEYSRALYSFIKTGGKEHSEDLTIGADGSGGYHWPGSETFTRQRLVNGRPKMGAALYEGTLGGSDSAGGYAISVPTDPQLVPLALPDLGIFDASTLIPTSTDVKIPQQASFGTSALKSESNGTLATFGGSDPTLGQITLSSFMAGAIRWVSWELLQDVDVFQQFVVSDLLAGQRILEGSLLATGTGSGQAQGVFGNTGNGTGSAYELTGTASTDGQLLLNALFDVTATLKAAYQPNASWIMSRATCLAIRKAQQQANLFVPVVTVDPDGTTRILGRPVYFDVNAPALPTATSAGVLPILYGDFKAGYIIGVRGGAGINVKILDQPQAAQGQLGILAYRRLDGRVRRSEAIQSITVSHS